MVFGYGWAVILTFWGTRSWMKHGLSAWSFWAFALAVVFLLLTIFCQDWLKKLFGPWMKLVQFIGNIVNTVLMTVMFFAVFAPVGLILRLLGKDLLHRKLDPNAKSYWILRPEQPVEKNRYTQQF